MNILLAAALLALPLIPVRKASADEAGWAKAAAAAARAAALPGAFDGIRLPGGAPAPFPVPGFPAFRSSPPEEAAPAPAPPQGQSSAGIAFNGVELPRTAFTGQESVSRHLVRAIDASQGSVRLLLYDFSIQEVWDALERLLARAPSVKIQVVLDQGHVFPRPGRRAKPIIAKLLAETRIETRVLSGLGDYGLMHNKIALFDGKVVKTGSFNWSSAAEKSNFENAVFSDEAARVEVFSAYFDWVWSLAGPPDAPRPPPTPEGPPPADASPGVEFHSARFPVAVFSPQGGAVGRVLDAIRLSRDSIDVAMFSFTSKPLAEALVERHAAGVRVRVVMDRKQSRSPHSVLAFLNASGVPVFVMDGKTKSGVLHHKFAVFDGAMVEAGSYNWTANGEYNSFENAAFLADPRDAAVFKAEFERLWSLAGAASTSLPGSASEEAGGFEGADSSNDR
ncbi:MAG: phospholipase D-like domain-containing protein [Elusimicrobiota bacterium]|jgi:phosphatidylserine/phosphatidylglycerophosphate/cardiolipin synthase-like enzyme